MAAERNTPSPALASVFTQHGTVTLLVRPNEEPLVAHERCLTKNSEFFQAALKKEWAEGQTRLIMIPEDDLATMTDYLTFTYSHELPTSKLVDKCPPLTDDDWTSLAKLCILGERALDTCIRNAVVVEIARMSTTLDVEGHMNFMGTAASNMLFDGTPEGSPIRRLIIDEYVFSGKKN
ncbi:hypothetical protein Q7P35_002555 [Cladosporium inversicolor]